MEDLQKQINEEFKKLVGVLPSNCSDKHLEKFRDVKAVNLNFYRLYHGDKVDFNSIMEKFISAGYNTDNHILVFHQESGYWNQDDQHDEDEVERDDCYFSVYEKAKDFDKIKEKLLEKAKKTVLYNIKKIAMDKENKRVALKKLKDRCEKLQKELEELK